MKDSNKINKQRRNFLGKGALLGGVSLAGMFLGGTASAKAQTAILKKKRGEKPYELNKAENIIYTSCLNCNTGCGIKVKIQDGVLSKIDGNPYNPLTMVPHIDSKNNIDDAAKIDGGLCPKGQAGVQIAYDPYRIRQVLKRDGKRGENKWKSVPFDQAIAEITEGGNLFAHVPGEENRYVEGLRSIRALKDNDVASEMAKDVDNITNEKDKTKKKELVEAFKVKYAADLDKLINPNHPDLGPKNNQFVVSWGRLKNGRKDFFQRLGDAFGTTNLHGHTTVCQGSLYFTCKAISEQYIGAKFTEGQKFYWQTDVENAEYILFVGANLLEANYGPTNRSVRLMNNLEKGTTKIGVVDPRFSKLASKASTWLPIKPGEDSALALAILQWMIGNNRYDSKFLKCANKAAAKETGEASWSNASWLVEITEKGPGKLVRATDLGIKDAEKRVVDDPKDKTKEINYTEDFFVSMVNGKPMWVDPNDEDEAIFGDLFVDTIIKNKDGKEIRVKTGMQLLKESANEKSFAEWCKLSGVPEDAVVEVATELTSHGKKASVDLHRGPAQHTNGFYNVFNWMAINMLLGNFDWAGGLSAGATYKYDGSNDGAFDLKKQSGKIKTFGISSIRHDKDYDKSTIFEGYPAKRNWYPLSSDMYQELIPSIGDAYPYGVKALFMYMGAPTYALPAGHTNIEVLSDVNKLPLFFTSDILVGTTSMYSDYIFPDLSYLERWEFQGTHPNNIYKVENVRQPAISPIPELVKVYGEEMPISLESLFMAINEKLGLKAFGKDALGNGLHIYRPEDLYLRAVANIATSENGGVPLANNYEQEVFSKARKHLDKSVFDEEKWKKIVGKENWAQVVYVLNRGGRFQEHSKALSGKQLTNKYGKLLNLYQEKTASKKYAGTGKNYYGYPKYVPLAQFDGKSLDKLGDGYEFSLITCRTVTQTKSRTNGAYWLTAIEPENGIVISNQDASRLGLKAGDMVKVVSTTNKEGVYDLKHGNKKEMIGKVIPTEGIRPGVISFTLGFGNWASGATDMLINGEVVVGDERRGKGIMANAAMWTDPSLNNNTCLVDPVGGSVSFYDTKVNLVKV